MKQREGDRQEPRHKARILLLHGDPAAAAGIEQELERSGLTFVAKLVAEESELLQQLAQFSPDLILFDYQCAGLDGDVALQTVRDRCPQIPCIVVTDALGEERAIETLKAGATDYVLKNRLQRLGPAAKRALAAAAERRRHRQAEAQLRLLAAAVEQAAESIVITDSAGVIEYVSPAFEQHTGYSAADAVGRTSSFLQSGEHEDRFYRELWGTLAAGTPWRGRFVNKRKDGQRLVEDAVISPVRDPAGRIVNYVAVKRDATREEALEAQVRHSQKLEAVGRLAGGVAHDFNNILMVILNCAEFVAEALPPGSQASADLEELTRTANRAASLTHQLLAFSRRQNLAPEVLDLSRLIRGLEKMMLRLLGEDIEQIYTLSEDLDKVCVDAGQLHQVVLNLAVNARDAMPQGGSFHLLTANVRLQESDRDRITDASTFKPGEYVLLQLSDDGAGMSEETQAHVFEPFYTTKKPGAGTGLGLATVFGIVKQHGGFVGLDATEGHGTTFRIYFPTHTEEALPAPDEAAIPVAGGDTILVVEDDDTVRATAVRILESLGYDVLEAAGGDAALALFAEKQAAIDLVLTDMIMPGMDGRSLAAALREAKPTLPILFISGYAGERLASHGITGDTAPQVLAKPVRRAVLARKIAELISRQREST